MLVQGAVLNAQLASMKLAREGALPVGGLRLVRDEEIAWGS